MFSGPKLANNGHHVVPSGVNNTFSRLKSGREGLILRLLKRTSSLMPFAGDFESEISNTDFNFKVLKVSF